MTNDRSSRSRGIRAVPFFRKTMFLLRYLTQLREWYIIRELKVLLKGSNARSVLDAGCGYGEYVYFIGSRYPEVRVTGLEMDGKLAADLAEFAEKDGLNNITVTEGDVLGLDSREAFDLALCGSVLEHIEDDETALARLAAALKPGGTIVVYVPVAARRITARFKRMEAKGKVAGEDHFGHVQSYTEGALLKKLKAAGLVVQKSVKTYGFFGALAYEILYTFLPHSSHFSRKHWLILPPYFLLLHPFVLLLMYVDFRRYNAWGNGLMVVAQRPL
jgi:SAM-dependent methyltransferase